MAGSGQNDDKDQVTQSVTVFDAGLKKAIIDAKQVAAIMPMIKPLIDTMQSVKHETNGRAVTITGRIDDSNNLLTMPLMIGGFAFRGAAAAPPARKGNLKKERPRNVKDKDGKKVDRKKNTERAGKNTPKNDRDAPKKKPSPRLKRAPGKK